MTTRIGNYVADGIGHFRRMSGASNNEWLSVTKGDHGDQGSEWHARDGCGWASVQVPKSDIALSRSCNKYRKRVSYEKDNLEKQSYQEAYNQSSYFSHFTVVVGFHVLPLFMQR